MALENVGQEIIVPRASWSNLLLRFGLAAGFVIVVLLYALFFGGGDVSLTLVVAAVVGAYMAMGIGANDVANNVGPAVGSKALTLGGAIVIAAIFEAAGALIAGGEVIGTIRGGIIDPNMIPDRDTFVWVMLAALLAAALWLNIATSVGAPVSTTHSIVGAVLGAGVAAGGLAIADWGVVSKIVASWVISPVMGGLIAAAFLFAIKRTITYQSNMATAARQWVPVLVALMGWAFGTYLLLKGVSRLVSIGFFDALMYGLVFAIVVYLAVRPFVDRQAQVVGNSKFSVNRLFNAPLAFAAALLCFAHGSNDVANAIGPLAAIVDVLTHTDSDIAGVAPIPFWVMLVGALGLSIGLALFGPRIIRTIGSEITDLDQMRAYCIAMAATITVIIASQLGIPISSTHTAVGAVMGVGFLREYLKSSYARMLEEIRQHHADDEKKVLDEFLIRFERATVREKGEMLRELKKKDKQKKKKKNAAWLTKPERKELKKAYRKELVKRSLAIRIIAAWIITVPASALMAAMLFFLIRGMMLP